MVGALFAAQANHPRARETSQSRGAILRRFDRRFAAGVNTY
jgi:hypothetical protein